MLFITNRALKEGPVTVPGRKVRFNLDNNEAGQSVFFCRRNGPDDYTEIGSLAFLQALKDSAAEQILIYVHGYSNLPEPDIFPRTAMLQKMIGAETGTSVVVVPVVWPCDSDLGIVKDYFDDQIAADASGLAFARVLEKFLAWRQKPEQVETPCLKRINVLAHSMGNRVLRQSLIEWASYFRGGELPLLFRNTFLVAADIVNESLEYGQEGRYICDCSRNVSVYFASDDLALRASKVANLKNSVASRRLGHTGPENLDKTPRNVFAIDCDDVNTLYDDPKGHSYFLQAGKRTVPGAVFKHLCAAIRTGRVTADETTRRAVLKARGSSV
jgi:esterase/lipase superfamily enzyme